ncbi:MAG TPA: oligosaccharide flippase family protein [Gaiella sp.]|jgi:O-antigen/teichoic acid export membrane protein|nr:oligosaccharide flippase family protein [Gaiella sp.]
MSERMESGDKDLREATISGVQWIAAARVLTEVVALASSVFLARLIPPAAFGHAAVALVVVGSSVIVGPAGISAFVVQRRDLTHDHLASTVLLTYTFGICLSAATAVFGLTLGESIFGDSSGKLIALAAPAWFLTAIGGVSQSIMQRELDFRKIAVRDMAAAMIGTTTAVVLALAGIDAPALVIGALMLVAVVGLSSAIAAPQPFPVLDRGALREISGFATSVSLSSIVYTLYKNVDYVILSIRLPAAQVGYYLRAYQLGVDYQSKLSSIMLRVSFPIFSRADDISQLRRFRNTIVRMHATILLPLLATFAVMAPDVIPFLYGEAWEPVVRPAQILAVAGMAYAITTGTGPVMLALGRARTLLNWNLFELVAYTTLIVILAGAGLIAVSIGVALYGVATIFLIQFFILGPAIGMTLEDLWHDVHAGMAAAALLVVTGVALRELMEPSVPVVVRLLVVAAWSFGLTVAAYRWLFPAVYRDLLSVTPNRGRRARAAT